MDCVFEAWLPTWLGLCVAMFTEVIKLLDDNAIGDT